MKLKSLLFGSAAAIVASIASTGAQAADPILVADPVDYVRICDAFGAGFFFIPGSNTCLKISGYARAEASWVQEGSDEPETYYTTMQNGAWGVTTDPNNPSIFVVDLVEDDGQGNPVVVGQRGPFGAIIGGMEVGGVQVSSDEFDNFTTRARGEVQFDARTETDMGILRSYVALRGTIGHNGTSDDFSIDKAFLTLQNDFGTFTAGHILSFFDFFGGYSLNSRVGGDDPTTTTNLFGYTFNAGNGFSASVSIEDRRHRDAGLTLDPVWSVPSVRSAIVGYVFTGSPSYIEQYAGAQYLGQEVPDFVANIRVDQGWGSAQIMGGLRQVNTVASSSTYDLSDYTDDKLGWVVGAGLTVDIPGTGIEASVQGAYTEGMTGYVTSGNGAVLTDAMGVARYDFTTLTESYSSELTKAWSIIAGLKADLTQTVEVRLNGTYADVDHAGSYYDYNTWTAAGTLLWTPVEGLTFGTEVAYERVDGDVSVADLRALPQPQLNYGDPTPVGVGDGDLWSVLFRVTRSF